MTTDVLVRDTTVDDLPILFLQQLEPEATKMAAFPARDHNAFMDHWTGILGDVKAIKQTISADGQVAGYMVSFDSSGERRVGYWIGKDYWGRGIATRALELFLRREPARPLHAHVAKRNVGSIRVLEKCGFTVVSEEKGVVRGDEVEEWILALGCTERRSLDRAGHDRGVANARGKQIEEVIPDARSGGRTGNAVNKRGGGEHLEQPDSLDGPDR